MAVSRLGTYTELTTPSEDSSGNIVVETGTQLLVVFFSAYGGTADYMGNGTVTIDGSSMTMVQDTSNNVSNPENVSVWYRVSPTTGASVSLAWTMTGWSEGTGMHIISLCYEGVNTGSPIKDSGENDNGNDVAGPLTVATGDMMVGAAASYNDASIDTNVSGQTEIVTTTIYQSDAISMAEKLSANSFDSDAGTDPSAVAMIIAQAAAGGGLSIPLVMAHYRRLRS